MIYLFIFFFISFFALFYFFKKSQEKSFKSISYDVMKNNNKMFFDLAGGYFEKYQKSASNEFEKKQEKIEKELSPVKESLKKLQEQTYQLEKSRILGFSSLEKQIDSLMHSETMLRKETSNLKKALQSPNIRGSWGQIHLRRVVELSGMLNNCDFYEQESKTSDEKMYRPDMIVRLPGGRQIVVDAKTPISAYLEASDILDEDDRKEKLKKHAKDLRLHIKELGEKKYWKQFLPTPEYVILFLPAEAFFSAALIEDPLLLEMGAKKNIVIATPSTLIAILRAVSYSWKQEYISKNAKAIAKVGGELYDRIVTLKDHWNRVGKSLNNSVDSYNKAISSFESRVSVSIKKLEDLGIEQKASKSLEAILTTTKKIN